MKNESFCVVRKKEQHLSCFLLIMCVLVALVFCKQFWDYLIMGGATALPATMCIYYRTWSISICKATIVYRKMFRERKYLTAQIVKVLAYASSAEGGEVLWVFFSNGECVKVAHSYQNYVTFRSYIMKHCSIEWK